nr:hypothetical protein [Tanacetum cinerariifolium]
MIGADEGGQSERQAGPDPGAQAEGQTGSDAGAQAEGQMGSDADISMSNGSYTLCFWIRQDMAEISRKYTPRLVILFPLWCNELEHRSLFCLYSVSVENALFFVALGPYLWQSHLHRSVWGNQD